MIMAADGGKRTEQCGHAVAGAYSCVAQTMVALMACDNMHFSGTRYNNFTSKAAASIFC